MARGIGRIQSAISRDLGCRRGGYQTCYELALLKGSFSLKNTIFTPLSPCREPLSAESTCLGEKKHKKSDFFHVSPVLYNTT